MRIPRIIPILTLLIVTTTLNVDAQCKAFAKKVCIPELGAYTHDGNYHAAILVEGEEAELYKTFYSDMEYRVKCFIQFSLFTFNKYCSMIVTIMCICSQLRDTNFFSECFALSIYIKCSCNYKQCQYRNYSRYSHGVSYLRMSF